MTKSVAASAAALAALAATPGVAVASGWRTVAHKATSGEFATTATSATVHHPRQIAVRLRGGSGDIVWACERGFSVASWSHDYGPGLHRLAHVAGKSSCDVTASVGGEGHISVAILTR